MGTNVVPGTLIAAPRPSDAAEEAALRMARILREAIDARGTCSIALSGGSSPVEAYERLSREPLDWTKVHVFWVDERAVGPDHARSNFGGAKRALLDPAGIPEANIHRMIGEAPDLAASARDYAHVLRRFVASEEGDVPRLDLAVLGIGDDGHVASLFPGEPTVHVDDRVVCDVPAGVGHEARLTLTTPTLAWTRASLVLVLGANKRPALERVWSAEGSLDQTPARIVRTFRGSLTWVTDHAAAGLA